MTHESVLKAHRKLVCMTAWLMLTASVVAYAGGGLFKTQRAAVAAESLQPAESLQQTENIKKPVFKDRVPPPAAYEQWLAGDLPASHRALYYKVAEDLRCPHMHGFECVAIRRTFL